MIGFLRFARAVCVWPGAGKGAFGLPRNTIFCRVVRDLFAMAPLYPNPYELHLIEKRTH